MENPMTIAVDLSKNVFEIAVERQGRICQRLGCTVVRAVARCPRDDEGDYFG